MWRNRLVAFSLAELRCAIDGREGKFLAKIGHTDARCSISYVVAYTLVKTNVGCLDGRARLMCGEECV